MAGRMAALLISVALVMVLGFLFLRITEKARAISVEGPENAPPPPARAPESLRVVTYHLGFGLGPGGGYAGAGAGTGEIRARLEAMGERLSGLGLDLVALQGVDFDSWRSGGMDQAGVLAEAMGFPYVVRQRNVDTGIPVFRRMAHGNALLSRFPVVGAERVLFPSHRNWERAVSGNFDGLLARVRMGEDRDVRVLVTELDARSEQIRVMAAGEMVGIQRADRLPMLILGSLHSTPPGFPMSEITASGQNAVELLESFGGFQRRPARGQATWHDFTVPTTGPRRIADWILPDRSWVFQQHRVLREVEGSRHFPVMGTVKLR
jgi:endonuclease/exonuclease/phosphatase family metal-dependent hydrolase